MEDTDRMCWICLCGADEEETVRVCACPRMCHKRCLGRWQLQNAGKREEKHCRFCDQRYPDWRSSLTPGEITPSTPVMAVSVRGKVYKLRVRPGPEGKEDFKRQIRQLLGFSADMDFDVIFECKTPHNGSEKVQLHGFEAFEAASWCAAVSAAKRKQAKMEKAAKAAAAAAAAAVAAGGGGSALTTTLSCPAALSLGDGRPSSSGGGSSSGGSSLATMEGVQDALGGGGSKDDGRDQQQQQQARALQGSPAEGSLTHTSAFARGQLQPGFAAPARRHQQQQQPGLGGAASGPAGALHPLASSGSVGPFGLQPAGSSYLQTAGSSVPHAIIEEPPQQQQQHGSHEQQRDAALVQPASPAAAAAVLADVAPRRQRAHDQDSCPHTAGGAGLGMALSMPVVGSTGALAVAGRGSSSSSSSGGSSVLGGRASDSSGGQEDGADRRGGGGKVSRWLRRMLHLEGPWRTSVPASMFMGIV